MTESKKELGARPFALIALLTFLPVILSFFVPMESVIWAEYLGLPFHLAVFFMVYILGAPEWGRAAGYGWILLDILAGVTMINGVSPEIGDYIRLTGHIFAGLWLISTSLRAGRAIRVFALITGIWLGGYTFVAAFLPMQAVGPASLFMCIWLALVAKENPKR